MSQKLNLTEVKTSESACYDGIAKEYYCRLKLKHIVRKVVVSLNILKILNYSNDIYVFFMLGILKSKIFLFLDMKDELSTKLVTNYENVTPSYTYYTHVWR